MRRREFIGLVGGAAASPLVARAQQQAMATIGVALISNVKSDQALTFLARLREGLGEYGYVEGQNFRFEFREANFQTDLLPVLSRELVDQKVSVIVTGTTAQLLAAKAATKSIPIAFIIGTDPVENGFVASLNKPAGNITGVFDLGLTLTGKQFEILHELIPTASKFAFLTDPADATVNQLAMPLAQAAADKLGVSLLHIEAHTPDEIEAALDAAARGGAGGLVLGWNNFFQTAAGYTPLVALAAHYRLPALFVGDAPVKEGGLISYGSDIEEARRTVGRYAARILRGAQPADLPVEQSTKTILSINLKTAKALGIIIPQTLLASADEVIE